MSHRRVDTQTPAGEVGATVGVNRRAARLLALVAATSVAADLVVLAVRSLVSFDLQPVISSAAVPSGGSGAGAPEAPAGRGRAPALWSARGTYIVVDRENNRLWLWRNGSVVLEAIVSTGSRTTLKEAGGARRSWMFDTPKGEFVIRGRRANPVWVKPDWAFLEEGREPPVALKERVETGSLGEWALDLGNGYMIHGTLYERLLGRSITHGCIRVGRDDLRVLAPAVGRGTRVFIF